MWREYWQHDEERLQCLKDIREKIVKDYEPLFRQQTGGLALVDVSVHDNLGDNLLTQGMIELVRTFHRVPTIICQDFQSRDKSVNPSMWWGWQEPWAIPKCNYSQVIQKIGKKGIILIQPGGNWGDMYYGVQENRLKYLQELKNFGVQEKEILVLQMPQSIHYNNLTKAKNDAKIINQLGSWFKIFVRSPKYLDFAQKLYPNTNIIFSPDIAFLIQPQMALQEFIADVYFLLRMGQESLDPNVAENRYEIVENILQQLGKQGLSGKIDFEWAHREQPYEMSSQNQLSFFNIRYYVALNQLSKGKIIVTDKLHGVILALLMGKPHVWIDTKQGKTSRVISGALELSNFCKQESLRSYQAENLQDAVDKAINLAKKISTQQ